MAIFGWFRKDEADFERVLDELDRNIQQRQSELDKLQRTEKFLVSRFTLYASMLYVFYALAWWLQIGPLARQSSRLSPDEHHKQNSFHNLRTTLPLAVTPVLIFGIRKTIVWVYQRRQRHQEGVLKSLHNKQKTEVERLKKKTKYDETRELLERYNTDNRKNPDISKIAGSPSHSTMRHSPSTPVQLSSMRGKPISNIPLQHPPQNPQQQQQMMSSPQMTPIKGPGGFADVSSTGMIPSSSSRGFVEKLTDALLGENENSPNSRYALICENCFSHNGLVLAEEFYTIQYKCPKCNHFNPPRRHSKATTTGESSTNDSPTSPASNGAQARPRAISHMGIMNSTPQTRSGLSNVASRSIEDNDDLDIDDDDGDDGDDAFEHEESMNTELDSEDKWDDPDDSNISIPKPRDIRQRVTRSAAATDISMDED